jgi:hypothetical protein
MHDRSVISEQGHSSYDDRRSPIWIACYCGGYVALLAWFKWVDVYHTQFATSGLYVLFYNLFRLGFIFYLFWIITGVGAVTLRLLGSGRHIGPTAFDSLGICFFTGVGLWHLVMLGLGFLNLYKPWVAIAMTVPLVFLSYFDFRGAMARLSREHTFSRLLPLHASHEALDRLIAAALIGLFLTAFTALLLVKGLYPAGGHDYFMHYFPYLRTVIERGGLWPNDVWYHFYYSKGAGLYFLGMLLTDPLAPQLVTFCFMVAGAIALFQFLSRLAPESWWPHVGVILWLGLYIFTPGGGVHRDNGGWGDFEKLHELNSALVIGIVWLLSGALEHRDRAWWVGAASATLAAIILNITMAVYLGMIFVLLAAWLLWKGRRADCLGCFALACVSGFALTGILLLNYVVTGLINDQGILLFWRFADIEKLYDLGTLPWVLMLYQSRVGLEANSLQLVSETPLFIFRSLRLDLLYPLVGTGALIWLAARLRRPVVAPRASNQLLPLTAAIAAYLVFAVAVGRAQPISFYRYSSFAMALSIALGVALWAVPDWRSTSKAKAALAILAPLFIVGGCFATASDQYQPGAFRAVLGNALRFARGTESIDQAYSAQPGWAGRLPWGAIYPGARGAYSVVGPHVPIWSMHMHSYCMLPDCDMRTHSAFTMARDWDRMMFGTPEEGREILQQAGLNYFLFSRELATSLGIVDVLPRSALFSPDNIGRYLGIHWTDGKTVLLTWTGPDTKPLDQEWLADYRHAVETSGTVRAMPYDVIRDIYRDLRATPHPWRSFKLPW